MATYFCVNSSLGQTWNSSNTTMWSTTSGLTTTPAGPPASGDVATFDSLSGGGTVTVGSSINTTNTVNNITMGAFTGTLDFSVNNININMTTFSGTGAGTRNFKMGNGTWTITGAGPVTSWDMTNISGLTFNANSSTLLFSINGSGSAGSNTRTVILGAGLLYSTISIAPDTAGYNVNFSSNNNTIGTFSLTAPINFGFGQNTVTISNPINWSGTSATNGAIGVLGGATSTFGIAAGSVMSYCIVKQSAFTGAGTPIAATNSIGLAGSNTGITFSLPSGGGGFVIGN